jgi:hypothetical protein
MSQTKGSRRVNAYPIQLCTERHLHARVAALNLDGGCGNVEYPEGPDQVPEPAI